MNLTRLSAHALCFLLLATSFAAHSSLTGILFLRVTGVLLCLSFAVSYVIMTRKTPFSPSMDKTLLIFFDAVSLVFFVHYSLKVYDEGFLLRFVNLLEIIVCLRAFLIRTPRDYVLFYFCGLVLIGCASFLTHELYFVAYLLVFFMLLISAHSFSGILLRAPHDAPSFIDTGTKKSRLAAIFLFLCAGFMVLMVFIFAFLPRTRSLNARILPLFFGEDESRFIARKNTPDNASQGNATADLNLFNTVAVLDGTAGQNEKGGKSRAMETLLLNPVVMYVKSTKPSYWRGHAFDFYTGRSWLNKESRQTVSSSRRTVFHVDDERENAYNRLSRTRERVDQIFFIKASIGKTLYAAYIPKTFYFPSQQLRVSRSLSVESPYSLGSSLVYYVRSERIQYNPNIFRDPAQRLGQAHFKEYLQLPYPSARIEALAKSVTKGHPSTLKKAEAIANYLRTHYTYDLKYLFEDPPPGKDLVEHFLFKTRRGHCELFASAYVVMARHSGIPSRFITGYAPGIYNPVLDSYEVRALDGHAWAESYIPEVGWLQFEATPESELIWKKLQFSPESPFLSSLFAYISFRLEKIPYILPRKEKAPPSWLKKMPALNKLKSIFTAVTESLKRALRTLADKFVLLTRYRTFVLCAILAFLLLLRFSGRFRVHGLIFTLRTYYTVRQRLFLRQNVRQQILEMYRGSLAILKARGLFKKAHETPYEFLEKCQMNPVKKEALSRLTDVFVKMRYSPLALTPEDGQISLACFYKITDARRRDDVERKWKKYD